MKLNEISSNVLHKTEQFRLKKAKQMGFDVSEVWYHGSREKFDTINRNRTSHGYFVTNDPSTAEFYSGDDGYIYTVVLKCNNILDLTEGIPESFAKEMLSSEPEYDKSHAYQFIKNLYDQNNKAVVNWIDSMKETPEETSFNALDDNFIDGQDILNWLRTHDKELARKFENTVDKSWEDYNYLINDYQSGTGSFYSNWQNDILKTADRLGYDAVDMFDPSSTGESFSRVIFDPKKMFIISRQTAKEFEATHEINYRF